MTLSRRSKIAIFGVLGLLILVFLLLPLILGLALRGTAERKIHEATNAPVRLAGLTVRLLPAGATLSGLEIGNPDPAAGNHPVLKADSISANVTYGTVFGGDTHITSLSVSGVALNIAVDRNGVSSFTKFLDAMPVTRKVDLPIDALALRDVHLATYLDRALTSGEGTAGQPDGTLDVKSVSARNLILAPPGGGLARQVWIQAELDGIVCAAPALGAAETPAGGVADDVRVEHITVEIAQALSPRDPVLIKHLELVGLQYATVYTGVGRAPAAKRAIAAVQYGMGTKDKTPPSPPPGASEGAKLLIESLTVKNGRFETRGPDAGGTIAYWRLKDLNVDGANLAYGPGVKAPGPGHLKINSESESSAGPGRVVVDATNLTGSYPRWSFDLHYQVEGVAAAAFTVPSKEAKGPGIEAGHVAMVFAGPCRDGSLNFDGSVTLSDDFRVDSSAGNLVAKIERGNPIGTIRVRGTLENPEFTWPDAFAGVLGHALKKIALGGDIGILDSSGAFLGAATSQGVREAGKVIKDAGGILSKIPGIFGGD